MTQEKKNFFQTYERRKSTIVAHPVYGYRNVLTDIFETLLAVEPAEGRRLSHSFISAIDKSSGAQQKTMNG